MCCRKFCQFIINIVLPFSILCIFLLQIYAQYSTLVTLRTKRDNQRDGRNTLINYRLNNETQYDFNLEKVKECFEDNSLMNIKFIKNFTLNFFDQLNSKKENKYDTRVYMVYYLLIYDIICIIIVYTFIYGSIKAGILKIILQIIRFYFNSQRIKKFNRHLCLFSIIKSKIENMFEIRGWNFFNPEGFLVIEFLCNFAIILDFILLFIYIYRRRKFNQIKKGNIILEDRDYSDEDEKDNNNNNEKNKNNDEENSGNNNIILNKDKRILDSPFEEPEEEVEKLSEESDHKNNNKGETVED
jgi:hypothetical protein